MMDDNWKIKIEAQIKKALDAENTAQGECEAVSALLAEAGYSHYFAQRIGGDGILFMDSNDNEYYKLDDLTSDDEWEEE